MLKSIGKLNQEFIKGNMQKEMPKFLILLQKNFGLVLFLCMFVIALFSFDKYGLSWDEPTQRYTGILNYDYIFSDNQTLLEWKDRDYGVAFELPLIMIEKTFKITDSRSIYLTRHLVTHIFFLIGAFFFFKLIDLLYKNKLLATLGFFMIILNPCIYAHSFFNTKDIPFMSMFTICLYLTAVSFRKKTIINFMILGISIGLLINLRIMGILLPGCILLFLMIDAFHKKEYILHLKSGLILIVIATIVLCATWPFLWSHPIDHFLTAYKNMSNFRWDSKVLFNGNLIYATKLGWNYIPIWFLITTPIFYIIIGFSGIGLLIFHFFKNPLAFIYNFDKRNNLLFLICFFSPVLAVIILKSVLYDSWRQMYFIYPSFVMLAIYGMHFLFMRNKRRLVVGSFLLVFIFISAFMIKNFPFEHVYFNSFVALSPPEHIRKNFELDYWGTSYKNSLEYVLKYDPAPSVDICVANIPGELNIDILAPEQKSRIHFVSVDKAKYFITNYRGHPEDYIEFKEFKYHSFKVANNTINEIFKLK